MKSDFQKDEQLITQLITDKQADIEKKMDTDVDIVYEGLEQVLKILAFETNRMNSKLVDFLSFCAGATSAESSVTLSPSASTVSSAVSSTESLSEESILPYVDAFNLKELLSASITTSSFNFSVLSPNTSSQIETPNPSQIDDISFSNDNVTMVPIPSGSFISGDPTDAVGSMEISSMILIRSIDAVVQTKERIFRTTGIDSTATTVDNIMATTSNTQGRFEEQHIYPWLEITSLDQCDEAYSNFSNHVNDVIPLRHADINFFEQEFFILADDFANSFEDSWYVKRFVFPECFGLIQQGKDALFLWWSIRHLIHRVVEGDFEEGLAAVEEIQWRLEFFEVPESSKEFDSKLEQVCDWQKDFSESVRQRAAIDRSLIACGREALFEANSPIQRWYNIMINIGYDIVYQRSLLTDSMVKYLDKDITKQELSHQFFSEQEAAKREALYEDIKEMEDVMQKYQDQIYLISDYLHHGYLNLKYENPQIINYSSVHLLELVKQALTVESLADWAQHGFLEDIIENIQIVLRDGPIKAMNRNVTEPLLDMQRQLRIVETNLREYQESIKMDSQFYL